MEQSCSIRKYIPKDHYLLNKVKVKGEPSGMDETLYNLSKQKPNSRLFFVFRYNMWRYLVFSSRVDAIFKRDENIKNLTLELKNLKAEYASNEAGYSEKQKKKMLGRIAKLQSKLEAKITTAEEIANAVDAPVVLDSQMCKVSAQQMMDYLWDQGYFKSKVDFRVYTHGPRANVYFDCTPGPRYYINSYVLFSKDSAVGKLVNSDTSKFIIKKGNPYSRDMLLNEESRINTIMVNNGYYKFKMQNFYISSDTFGVKGDSIPIRLEVKDPGNGSKYKVYKIKKVYVEPEYELGDTIAMDIHPYKEYIFLDHETKVLPSVLYDFLYIKPNSLFNEDLKKKTLNRLWQLGAFKFVDIRYIEDAKGMGDTGILDCHVRMTPAANYRSTTSIEINRTEEADRVITNNYSNLYGVALSYDLLNRNLARRALQFETTIRGAVEVPFDSLHFLKPIKSLLNYSAGMSNSLIFPRLLLYPHFLWWNKAKNYPTLTSFNLNLLFEHNGYYNRTTGSTNLTWQINNNNKRFYITPIELSLINAHPQASLKLPNDPLILNLFDQHLITDFRFFYLYNLQPITNVIKNTFVFRGGFEIGGFVPLVVDRLFDNKETKTGEVTRNLFGIKYFNYSKLELDFRGYVPVLKSDNLAMRFDIGVGTPMVNSTILPFEKRFYAGGANSVRAWRARDLGPGGFQNPAGVLYDKSGDFKLEGSFEYRFPIYKFLKAAVFTDYGNVWLYRIDSLRPGATISPSFYKQIAIGSGIGFRFDFSFFVFRLDFAVPMRDPALSEKDRWVFNHYYSLPNIADKLNVNIGIGYPF